MNANFILKGILHVLFKRKTQVIGFFFATVITVAPLALLSGKPVYQASSQIRLELGREFISDLRLDTLGAVNPVVRFNPDEQLDLAIEIIKGHSLAIKVIDELGLRTLFPNVDKTGFVKSLLPVFLRDEPLTEQQKRNAAVEVFIDNINAEKTPHSSLINISYEHHDPEIAALAANTLVKLYIERHLGIRRNPRSDEFFRQQFDTIKGQLAQAEQQLSQFKRQHQISASVNEERELLIAQINKLQAGLNEAVSLHSEMTNRLERIQNQLANTARNPGAITMLQEKLLTLQLKESEMALNYNSESRTLDNLRSEIGAIKTKLAEAGANKRYGSTAGSTGSGSLYQNLQADLLKTQADLSAVSARKAVNEQQLTALKERLAILDSLDVEFSNLQQQVDVAKENYSLYLSRFEELRISKAMDAEKISSISVIEPARVPIRPVKSKIPLQLALAVFVGLVGGVGLAFLLEMLYRTVDRREDVEQELGVPVLASVPDFAGR